MNNMGDGSASAPLPAPENVQRINVHPAGIKTLGIYGFDSIDPRSRSFNLIRARLGALHRERGWRMFGIVSAAAQVGKSFIAINVAAALSRNPRYETTLVDLDLRRGSVSAQCGIDPEISMRDFLDGDPDVRTPPAYMFEGERLMILPTRAGVVRSAELLAGGRAQSMLRAMRSSGENRMYIVDLPPVFANDDASTVLPRLDAYILVAEEGKTTKREIRESTALLGLERLAGVVLNKYRGGLMSEGYGVEDYYNRGYGAPIVS